MSRPDPRGGGDAFVDFVGMRFGPGEVRLEIAPHLLNSNGMLLGPVGFALVDYGMAALLFERTTTQRFATTGISINYLASASEGEVVCRAKVDRLGRRGAFLSAELVHDSGKLLATAIGTFAMLDAPATLMITQIEHVEGEEEQFNTWFARHIAEVRAVPGVDSVQRYRATDDRPALRRWLTIFRLSGDVPDLLDELTRRLSAGDWEPRVSIVEDTISLAAFEPVNLDGSPLTAQPR
jgi:uncharacterized protein (TIGR00369 family)